MYVDINETTVYTCIDITESICMCVVYCGFCLKSKKTIER